MDPTSLLNNPVVANLGVMGILIIMLVYGILQNNKRADSQNKRDADLDTSFQKIVEFHDKSVAALERITTSFVSSMDRIGAENQQRDTTMQSIDSHLQDPQLTLVRMVHVVDAVNTNTNAVGGKIIGKVERATDMISEVTKTQFNQLLAEFRASTTRLEQAIKDNKVDAGEIIKGVSVDVARIRADIEILRTEQLEAVRKVAEEALVKVANHALSEPQKTPPTQTVNVTIQPSAPVDVTATETKADVPTGQTPPNS